MAGVGLNNLVKYLLSKFRVAGHLPHSTVKRHRCATLEPRRLERSFHYDRILALEKQTHLVGGGWSPIEGLASLDRDTRHIACLGMSVTEIRTYTCRVYLAGFTMIVPHALHALHACIYNKHDKSGAAMATAAPAAPTALLW